MAISRVTSLQLGSSERFIELNCSLSVCFGPVEAFHFVAFGKPGAVSSSLLSMLWRMKEKRGNCTLTPI